MENIKRIKFSIWVLLVVGHLSIFGKILGNDTIQGLGFLTTASPLPLVFSSFRGVEGFASQFYIEFQQSGENKRIHITPKAYEKLKGPYNRRNAYGAAIAGAPMLTGEREKPMIDAIHRFGFCKGGLKKEFRVSEDVTELKIIVESKTIGQERSWEFPVNCND